MMEVVTDFFDYQDPLWSALLFALLLAATISLAWSPLTKIIRHWQLQRLIKRLGYQQIRHAVIPDQDEDLYIEHLLLRQDGLLLVMVKPFRGNIFAADKIEMWTQVLGHHSYKFANPLYELEHDTQLLRGLCPKVPIDGLVVFAQGSRFPKGKPAEVCDYPALKQLAQNTTSQSIPESLRELWESLRKRAVPAKNLQAKILYQRGDRRRLGIAIVLFILSALYASWYAGWLINTG